MVKTSPNWRATWLPTSLKTVKVSFFFSTVEGNDDRTLRKQVRECHCDASCVGQSEIWGLRTFLEGLLRRAGRDNLLDNTQQILQQVWRGQVTLLRKKFI